MYIYFDNDKTIKEIINTKITMQGDLNDKLFIYWEGASASISNGFIRYRLPDGTLTQDYAISLTRVNKQIPYNKKQDLKYFEYFKNYAMYEITAPALALQQTGVVKATLSFDTNVLESVLFNVEESVIGDNYIATDTYLNLAQYRELVANYISKTGIKTINNNTLLGSGNISVQETLVSGSNIKTINGQTILGQGDLAISGAGTVTSVSAGTGLTVVGNPNVNPTIMVGGGFKIPTEQEFNNKANNGAVVHNTGDEPITGTKTFTNGANFAGPTQFNSSQISVNTASSEGSQATKISSQNKATETNVVLPSASGTLALTSDLTSKENVSNKVSSWNETTTDTNYPSEKLVKDGLNTLQTEIDNLKSIGRFLSVLDASNGHLGSQPSGSVGDTYNYKVGDYYRVGASGNYTPKTTATFTIDNNYGATNFELGQTTYNIGDVIYCSSISGNVSTWVKQSSSGGGTVQDVKVNGTSVLSGGIANIDISGKADLSGGNTFTGEQVFNNGTSNEYQVKLSNGVQTKDASISANAQTTYKTNAITNNTATITLPTNSGTLALTSEIPSVSDVLRYSEQTLTAEQKEQARTNIGAVSVSQFEIYED